MSAKKTYWELLRDPQWQKLRLEIMQRDDFACTCCGASDQTLNVHHTYYAKGRAPWEYEPESLQTLCEACHRWTEDDLAELRRLIGMVREYDRWVVRGYLQALVTHTHRPPSDATIPVPDYHDAAGIADYYKVTAHDVESRVRDGVVNMAEIQEVAQRRVRALYGQMLSEEKKSE